MNAAASAAVAAAEWITVCPLDAILPNGGVCAKVGDAQVAVFRLMTVDGDEEGVFAIGNFDPQSHANVLSRGIVGDVQGEAVVASPIYKHHYSLKTGKCLEDESIGVPTYAVRVDNGIVHVQQPD